MSRVERTVVAMSDGNCPQCGHSWSNHRNLVACNAVVGRHPDGENFGGALIRCMCEELPIEAGCAVHGSAHPCEEGFGRNEPN